MPQTILITTALSADGLATLRAAPDAEVRVIAPNADDFDAALATSTALVVGDDLQVDEGLLARAPDVRVVARAGASLVNIDLDAATRRGIIVMNTPGVDAVTVAEYVFALMLALVRGVVGAHADLLDGRHNPAQYIGRQLAGKTLGIVGLGRVGMEVAMRAIAFGLDVIAADPYVGEQHLTGMRVKLVGLGELLGRADIITLHSSLVPETEGFICAQTLAQMKPGVYLINAKHAEFIHVEDTRAALESGHLAGLALDDFAPEGLAAHPLIGHPRVIHTQRMRSNTAEAQHDLSSLLAPQILDALRGHDYRNTVNLPFMPGQEYEKIAPQMRLGQHIGALLHHLGRRAPVEKVEVNLSGEEMRGLMKPFTVAILVGLLRPALGEALNFINAPVIAAERGIAVSQSKALSLDAYPNLVGCRVHWADGGSLLVNGALFNQTEPRIVQIDQYRTDFAPQGVLLIMGSYDVPGVIGTVGTFMADQGINIAAWRTSRAEKGGQTLTAISIDTPLGADGLAALRAHDFVRHATQIVFDDKPSEDE
ncbi:MAG: NAD(P)-dependent oxidoreductase [Anaerolineales bacterium]